MDLEQVHKTLAEAIRAEVDGYHFYKMAAQSTADEQGKQVFEKLADDEVVHARFLQAQYDAIAARGKVDPSITLREATDFGDGEHPIFSAALKARVKEAHYEMSALSIGAQLELSAVEFYRRAAEGFDDELLAGFCRRLADWERRHYDALIAQQRALHADYATAGRFSPF